MFVTLAFLFIYFLKLLSAINLLRVVDKIFRSLYNPAAYFTILSLGCSCLLFFTPILLPQSSRGEQLLTHTRPRLAINLQAMIILTLKLH